jgi:hypothetical protein
MAKNDGLILSLAQGVDELDGAIGACDNVGLTGTLPVGFIQKIGHALHALAGG